MPETKWLGQSTSLASFCLASFSLVPKLRLGTSTSKLRFLPRRHAITRRRDRIDEERDKDPLSTPHSPLPSLLPAEFRAGSEALFLEGDAKIRTP